MGRCIFAAASVFIIGHGDISMSVTAMKGGAIEFLTKPFRNQDLLDAIQLGLARDRARLEYQKSMVALRARFETLTSREREVMALVVAGRLNKQIAYEIGVSEIMVKSILPRSCARCGRLLCPIWPGWLTNWISPAKVSKPLGCI